MKKRIIQTVFVVLFITISSAAVFGQDDAAYRKALAEAYAQSNPSEYRAQALKKVLENEENARSTENTRMSENEWNQFIANKMKELSEIDFYAAFLSQSITTA